MSQKERERMKLFERVKLKELKLIQASQILSQSYRQTRRQYAVYREQGEAGLIHRGRGKQSNRSKGEEFRQEVLKLYREKYPDFGPTLAAEKLLADGYQLDHETLRRWLLAEGLWQKSRRRAAHRSWRERRAHFGELLQMDGSHHRWFEGRGEEACLMNLVDDATGRRMSLMAEEETTEAAMRVLWRWIERHGIPASLYVDRKSVYVVDEATRERARDRGEQALTQFGRACQQLGIKLIEAHSPQAKGRVERAHGVDQDRLVKELRLAEINGIVSANEFLSAQYLDQINRKFALEPREQADYHRSAKGYDLAAIFCHEEDRVLSRDWIVRFKGKYYQLERQSGYAPSAARVQVRQYLDGELRLNYRGQDLAYRELSEGPVKTTKQAESKKPPEITKDARPKPKSKPSADHPWRKPYKIAP